MTTPTDISRRLALLREVLQREHLFAFIFPSTDPHNGEYIPDHWKSREWISGFNGSAGTAVVTLHSAALWTDSRYFIAAEEQLKGTGFELMKLRISGTPTIAQWIASQRQQHDSTEVGIDGMTCAYNEVVTIGRELQNNGGMTLRTNLDPLKEIWEGRPKIPRLPVTIHPMEYAGEAVRDKLARIRTALRQQHADGMLVTALDDIAWTLNIRGNDVQCNPVAVSYLLITTQKATLYIYKEKVSDDVAASLKAEGVELDDYDNIRKGIADYFEYNILVDPNLTCYTLYKAAEQHRIVPLSSPIPSMKAIKNERERLGFKQAMLRDGIAMTKFLAWLLPAVRQGGQTELSVTRHLEDLRAQQPNYHGPSFDTITAYQEHGAIVHYEPTEVTDVPLRAEGLLLIDSGGQYDDGTTDITRTIALGPLTEEQRKVYTLVLKGHIQLQLLRFPEGASGTQLDAVARRDLWAYGYNYLHGTGHGVGSYLNVHEGPHQIRMEWKPAPMLPHMTVTDEPGIYLEGRFGVRIENTLITIPYMETECGRFLAFETLTLCPIDTTPVIADILTDEEKQWLNSYHNQVREALLPHLTTDEQQWLTQATSPII